MNWALLLVYVVLSLVIAGPAIRRPEWRLQFPCLASLGNLFLVALPMASLNLHPELVEPTSLSRFSVMAILCLSAAWIGYRWRGGVKSAKPLTLDLGRLSASACFLAAFGFYFGLKYTAIEPEFDPEKGGMTGIGTIYLTLARVMVYGFMIAGILLMRTRKWAFFLIMVPQLWAYYSLFVLGRRSPTGEIVIVCLLLLFFYRHWSAPFWALVAGTVVAAIFTYNVGQIRSTVDQGPGDRIRAFLSSDPLKALTVRGMAEDNRHVEIYNAAKFMEARALGRHYSLGLHFWNQLVFGYVPAQIVGAGIKKGLMLPLTSDEELTGFEKSVGTCESGIAEAFMAFWYFGCLVFFGLGWFMRYLWDAAANDSILHQLALLVLTLPAVLTFSGQIWTFLNTAVNLALFAGPFLWWSWIPNRSRDKTFNKSSQASESGVSSQTVRRRRRRNRRRGLNPAAPDGGLES